MRAMSIEVRDYREQVKKIWGLIKEAKTQLNGGGFWWKILKCLDDAEIEARELESTLSFEQEDWEKKEKELMEKLESS